ncbi:MAG: carbohydrate binding domain-containing protein [Planctomycetaceae bacterium]|nr:carbohydrate binding domain-containing protein [Planctomycetaceae bacterium]
MKNAFFLTFLFLVAPVLYAEEPVMFPFLISYGGADNATSMQHLLSAPAGKDGFVRIENGSFVNDAGRIRLHATNLTGPANFPEHEQSDKLAERLARFGINCVRLHYFDAYYGNFMTPDLQGIIADDPETQKKFDPKQRDKQDYLIAALKKKGIYINMNLHVARGWDKRDGFEGPKPGMDKGLDNFEPEMIRLQKEYAKELLTHVNPYTGIAYKNEPSIAVIEINNENALFSMYRGGGIDNLADRYKKELQKQWNNWLKKKYKNTAALKDAWKWESKPLRDEQVPEGSFNGFDEPIKIDGKKWIFALSSAKADAKSENGVLKITVAKKGEEYFPKLFRSVKIKKDETYTLKFKIRTTGTPESAVLGLAVAESAGGWKSLGAHQTITVGKNWKTFEIPFTGADDSDKAQIQITRFTEGTYEIDDLSLQTGVSTAFALTGSLEDETIPNVPARGGISTQAKRDFVEFLYDTEMNYWTGMQKYIRNEVGAKQMISGTQLGYSPTAIQAALDYVDDHAYWCHPSPVSKDWRITNTSLVGSLSCIIGMATQRVAGKPFTVSEYNHPFPNFYGAEGQPFLRAYGALQDWDGVFEYTYNHSRDFEPLRNTYFFSIIARTDVLAHFPACAAMFLRGDVKPANKTVFAKYNEDDFWKRLASFNTVAYSIANNGFDRRLAVIHRTGISLDGKNAADPDAVEKIEGDVIVSDTGELTWNKEDAAAPYWTANTANTKFFIGFPKERTISLGNVSLTIGKTKLNWATVSLTSRQGTGFDGKNKSNILLTATGYCENENMKVVETGAQSITLSDWGNGTILAEGIQAEIVLPSPVDKTKCFALAPDGSRKTEVPVVKTADGKTKIEISPKYKTVWYEIEVR